ncbi:MAG TPA: hypothetical protein VJP02_04585 [Candidatus Sulfotelmatobacter sp.]|nr:hypothetical protein [Candidatus Sulfotelmatobacter sp.]
MENSNELFNERKKKEAQRTGEIIGHDAAEPGQSETGARMSPLPNYPQDFPTQRVDLGANREQSEAVQSPLENTLPMSVSPVEIAATGNRFWQGSEAQGAKK